MNVNLDMLSSVYTLLWPLALILAGWAAFTGYVFIKSPTYYYLRFGLIPTVLISAIFSTWILSMGFGYAVPYRLPDDFEFLDYHVVHKANRKATIEVWTLTENRTKVYAIPYTEAAEKAFEEAKEKGLKGGRVRVGKKIRIGHRHGFGENENDDEIEGGLESRLLLPEDINPKVPISHDGAVK